MHYWKDCPMLTTCWECEQVIEIKQVEEHLIEECQFKEKYRYHAKSKQVTLAEEYDQHDNDPPPKPEGAVRCPLCSQTVYPNDNEGWKHHLMV